MFVVLRDSCQMILTAPVPCWKDLWGELVKKVHQPNVFTLPFRKK